MNGIKSNARLLLQLVLILVVGVAATAQEEEGGGQSGAEFLLNPSTPRTDAMGGVVDGQGDPLEGMFFNPSILIAGAESAD